MSNDVSKDMDLLEEYANNLAQLQRWNRENEANTKTLEGGKSLSNDYSLSGLSDEKRKAYADMLYRNREIRQLL
jgi:hypothetical protein